MTLKKGYKRIQFDLPISYHEKLKILAGKEKRTLGNFLQVEVPRKIIKNQSEEDPEFPSLA